MHVYVRVHVCTASTCTCSCTCVLQVSVLHLVPPLVLFLAKDPQVLDFDLSSVQKVVCAAAPLGEGISRQFSERSNALLMQGRAGIPLGRFPSPIRHCRTTERF